MNPESYRTRTLRSALALGLIAASAGPRLLAQQRAQLATEASSGSSGLLDAFHTAATVLPSAPAPAKTTRHRVDTSVSLGAFGQFTATRTTTTPTASMTESLGPSAGVLGTVRQSFRPWLGYSLNMGFTHAAQHYATLQTNGAQSGAAPLANVYEYSLSYLAERRIAPRLSGFADLGAGAVVFQPTEPPSGIGLMGLSTNYRPAGVGGVGVDYALRHHLGLRAEYRGQLFKYPDYGGRFPRSVTVTSEPTFSLTYTFGKAPATKP